MGVSQDLTGSRMKVDVTGRRGRTLASLLTAIVASLWVLGGMLLWLNRSVIYGNDVFLWLMWVVTGAAYVGSALAIVRRQPFNPVGWLFFWIAGALAVSIPMTEYGVYAITVSPHALLAPGLVLALAEPTPTLALIGIILVLQLFPDGRSVSRRWRPVVWLTVAAGVLGLGRLVTPHRIRDIWSDMLSHTHTSARDPLGVEALRSLAHLAQTFTTVLVVVVGVLSVASLFVRHRRADATERAQLRWLALVVFAAAIWIVVVLPLASIAGSDGPAAAIFWLIATPLVALGPPIAVGIAIVRYRLFDIDVVINKTVVFGVLAVFITVVYVAIVVGFGALVGAHANAALSASAAAIVAIAFQPVRRHAQRLADRLVYGKRATPYEVLAEFSERMTDAYATDDVLPRMARLLVGATGATSATVWLLLGTELRPAASAGDGPILQALPASGPKLPDVPADFVAQVNHQGEMLGALAVVMPDNDALDPGREKLVRDLASQAGLVLRNVRLIEELKASRQRLVSAQDQERRKLERNIHDGAQQQLVALAIKIRLAQQLTGRDPAKANDLLEQTAREVTEALEDLRDLARGIYPPLLADQGLAAALEVQARKAPVATSVDADGVGRYPQEIETAVYFCCLEALNNVAKYAHASSATVKLFESDGILGFEVADDGTGFDPASTGYGTGLQGMADRLEATGGRLEVTSARGAGSTITGRVAVAPVP
jgi:signal transduction histidine kinase